MLVGGRSRRMGRDKALVEVYGEPLGRRCVRVLVEVGCEPVLLVGGQPDHASLGGRLVEDPVAGGGPAMGVAHAVRIAVRLAGGDDPDEADATELDETVRSDLGRLGAPGVLVLPTDLPAVTAEALSPLVEAAAEHGDEDAILATVGGRRAYPIGVWWPHRRFADPSAFAGRPMAALVEGLVVREVECGDALLDADVPDALPAGSDGDLRYRGHDRHGGMSDT